MEGKPKLQTPSKLCQKIGYSLCLNERQFRVILTKGQLISKCLFVVTLSFYNTEPSKNKHFLILLSSLARNSQEPKLKRILEILWVLIEKSLNLVFDWPKSWIWQTTEKVMDIFCKWHFHNASIEVFWQKKIWISCAWNSKNVLA